MSTNKVTSGFFMDTCGFNISTELQEYIETGDKFFIEITFTDEVKNHLHKCSEFLKSIQDDNNLESCILVSKFNTLPIVKLGYSTEEKENLETAFKELIEIFRKKIYIRSISVYSSGRIGFSISNLNGNDIVFLHKRFQIYDNEIHENMTR